MPTEPLQATAITLPGWIGTAVAIVVSIVSPVYVSGQYSARIDAQGAEIQQLRAEIREARAELRSEIQELRRTVLERSKP